MHLTSSGNSWKLIAFKTKGVFGSSWTFLEFELSEQGDQIISSFGAFLTIWTDYRGCVPRNQGDVTGGHFSASHLEFCGRIGTSLPESLVMRWARIQGFLSITADFIRKVWMVCIQVSSSKELYWLEILWRRKKMHQEFEVIIGKAFLILTISFGQWCIITSRNNLILRSRWKRCHCINALDAL